MAKAPPVAIADGDDTATGTTTDAAWVSGAGTVISLLKKIAGGGGGGGPATIADGADVAQGTTTDASSANTVIGLLKAVKAAVQGTLTVGGTVTADTELPAAAVLADTDGNPTTSRVGANGLLWNGTSWDRAPGDKTAGLKVQSAQLPAALDGSGFLKVHEQGVAHIDDNAGSLTVDAPVGTPVFVRVSDGAAALVGQKAMAASLPIVVASDQSDLPANLKSISGTAIAAKAASTFGVAALPVWPNAVQRDTYYVVVNGLAVALTAGGGDKNILSLEHAAGATKTVRVRRILLSGVVTTASAAVAGNLTFKLFTGTAASSAGTAITPAKANQASAAAEVVTKTAPTITAAGGPDISLITLGTGAGGAVLGTQIASSLPLVIYDWQENGETVPITLRAANLETLLLVANGSWATTAPTITFGIVVILTEE